MDKTTFEKLMWSIALPGFGQYLNGKYFKGTVWLPMLCVIPGIIIGFIIREIINKIS